MMKTFGLFRSKQTNGAQSSHHEQDSSASPEPRAAAVTASHSASDVMYAGTFTQKTTSVDYFATKVPALLSEDSNSHNVDPIPEANESSSGLLANGDGNQPVKRGRGRPRKYPPKEKKPPTEQTPGVRKRGRPPGSGKKQLASAKKISASSEPKAPAHNSSDGQSLPPKKRGRPRKSDVVPTGLPKSESTDEDEELPLGNFNREESTESDNHVNVPQLRPMPIPILRITKERAATEESSASSSSDSSSSQDSDYKTSGREESRGKSTPAVVKRGRGRPPKSEAKKKSDLKTPNKMTIKLSPGGAIIKKRGRPRKSESPKKSPTINIASNSGSDLAGAISCGGRSFGIVVTAEGPNSICIRLNVGP